MNPIAKETGERLEVLRHEKVVFAESCTGGMAAGLLTQVPGISSFFCGSAVTYRVDSKIKWLGVSPRTIEEQTAESRQTTEEMALGALATTPEATIACSITGHLGPAVDARLDGKIFTAIAVRNQGGHVIESSDFRLKTKARVERQREAAETLLALLNRYLDSLPGDPG